MLRSLRARLGATFIGFLLLVTASVAATFLWVHTQAADATVINLASRQRMLMQKMTWLAFAQPESPELKRSIQLFDQTLLALRDGDPTLDPSGGTVTFPPAPDPALRTQLYEVTQTWAAFRAHLQPVEPLALQTESPLILAQLDAIVSEFEARAQAKLLRLQSIQLTFFFAALMLLAWGYLLTRRRLLQPLATLGAAARRMAAGSFAEPVPALLDDELGELGWAFERMRLEIAAAHDRLESRVTQRTRELVSAFEFGQEIVAQFDLDHLLRSATERARALTHAKAASLCLLDKEGQTVALAASSGDGSHPLNLRQPFRHEPLQRVIGAGETVIIAAACTQCGFLQAHAPGQCAAAPLRAGETTLGALCVVRDEGERIDPDETRALTVLANSAAIAIANARLAEARRRQAEQAATLAERERLAAELHDHLAQTLSFLNLTLDRAKEMLSVGQTGEAKIELERMRSAVGTAYAHVRAALVGLQEPPPVMDNFGQKLAACVADFRAATGLPAELVVADPSPLTLSPVTQTQALHIVREALTNARRHAHARRVRVGVDRLNGEARFTVEDDGCGFKPQSEAGDNHLGLAIMRTRAERGGGRLTIDSVPGKGTKVIASFPCMEDEGRMTAERDEG